MSVRSIRPIVAVAAAGLAVALLAGCSSSSAGHPAAASLPAGGTAPKSVQVPTSTGGASTGPASQVSVRVAYFVAPGGRPGPAIDVCDVQLAGQAATPILTNIGYGTVSAYAHPHPLANGVTKVIELFALPTGEDPKTAHADAQGIGGLIDDGSQAQLTALLVTDSNPLGTTPLAGLAFSERMEKGDDGQCAKGPIAPPPPAGSGELMVDSSSVESVHNNGLYLLIDHSCAPPLNGDPNAKDLPEIFAASSAKYNSALALFPTSPGSHQVSVVLETSDVTPTCAQLTDKQATMSVDVTAGQQTILFLYGTSATDLHLVAAPVAP